MLARFGVTSIRQYSHFGIRSPFSESQFGAIHRWSLVIFGQFSYHLIAVLLGILPAHLDLAFQVTPFLFPVIT
jgi:hypothetical protein